MIDSSGKPVAFVDGQIELELVTGPRGRIWPDRIRDRWTAVDAASPFRLHTRGVFKKPRKLGNRDRSLVIKVAGGMTLMQDSRERRDYFRMGGREVVQIDLLSGPGSSDRC